MWGGGPRGLNKGNVAGMARTARDGRRIFKKAESSTMPDTGARSARQRSEEAIRSGNKKAV